MEQLGSRSCKWFIGPTSIIIDGMGLCRYDEHVKVWKWQQYMAGKFKYLNGGIVYGTDASHKI